MSDIKRRMLLVFMHNFWCENCSFNKIVIKVISQVKILIIIHLYKNLLPINIKLKVESLELNIAKAFLVAIFLT